ncbi:MAG: HD-GYP domain protein, partial [Lachnospiraceae bacterium]|nr:HD-GYP domain protein [Lachnospiraceae bacterium]
MRKTFIRQFLITMIVIFVLQALMLTYLFTSFYRSAAQDVKALGENNLKSQAAMIETYLNKGSDVLYIVADTAEHMIRSGASRQEILNYLVMETAKTRDRVDENFTGIYGYLNGSYLDGSGWEPPEDYDPKTRDWYREAIDAEGKMVLSAPYVDAQTGGIIVSFTKRLA